jgi:hypothetical protein
MDDMAVLRRATNQASGNAMIRAKVRQKGEADHEKFKAFKRKGVNITFPFLI